MAKAPDAFRTISEASDALKTPAHVLRFWESKFSQVKPVKRAGGRRYYRPTDIDLLSGIRTLLHDQGMTIRGVQKLIAEKGVRHVAQVAPLSHPPAQEILAKPEDIAQNAMPEPETDTQPVTPPLSSPRKGTGVIMETRPRQHRAGELARALRQGLPLSVSISKIRPLVDRLEAVHARLSIDR